MSLWLYTDHTYGWSGIHTPVCKKYNIALLGGNWGLQNRVYSVGRSDGLALTIYIRYIIWMMWYWYQVELNSLIFIVTGWLLPRDVRCYLLASALYMSRRRCGIQLSRVTTLSVSFTKWIQISNYNISWYSEWMGVLYCIRIIQKREQNALWTQFSRP